MTNGREAGGWLKRRDGHGRQYIGKQALRRWKAPAFFKGSSFICLRMGIWETPANPFGMSGLRTAACSITGQNPHRIFTHRVSSLLWGQAWRDTHYWIKHSLLRHALTQGFLLASSSLCISALVVLSSLFPSLSPFLFHLPPSFFLLPCSNHLIDSVFKGFSLIYVSTFSDKCILPDITKK